MHGLTKNSGWRYLPALAGSLALSLGCGDGSAQPECEEGSTDPACLEMSLPDGGGERLPQCMDGIDNDGDGLIDFPNDPGCTHPHDDSEEDDCPDGPHCPECSDGIDNDGDGLIDYPNDPGCTSAADPSELGSDCGGTVRLRLLPEDGTVIGHVLDVEESGLESESCGGAGAETVYLLSLSEPTAVHMSTDNAQTNFDPVLYVRSACTETESELGCAAGRELRIDRLEPGDYYLVVDSAEADRSGTFRLEVDLFTPIKEACTVGDHNCTPGLVCREFDGAATETTCEMPQCSDGIDNDGDGQIDFPMDPGCSSPEDNDESTCDFGNPNANDCPECWNGIDDDADGLIDFGSDPACFFPSTTSENACPQATVPLAAHIAATPITGTTTDMVNDFTGTCGSGSGSARDAVHFIFFPGDLASLSLAGNSADTNFSHALYVRRDTCTSADLECNTGSSFSPVNMTLTDLAAGPYFIIVDGSFASSQGIYSFNISAVVKEGEACDPDQVTAGIATCEGDTTCQGGTCQ